MPRWKWFARAGGVVDVVLPTRRERRPAVSAGDLRDADALIMAARRKYPDKPIYAALDALMAEED